MISIGKRWQGKEMPPALPVELEQFVQNVEAELEENNLGSWTLTFLEGKPVVYHSNGAEATIDSSGALVVLGD
ncbi:MAG: hypothetical protein KF916_05745 [Microbacteriaceae bacterium]|nr:hypothetical protein [Microbacteriaceae bacterium]